LFRGARRLLRRIAPSDGSELAHGRNSEGILSIQEAGQRRTLRYCARGLQPTFPGSTFGGADTSKALRCTLDSFAWTVAMNNSEELFTLAKKLEDAASAADAANIKVPLDALVEAANEMKQSFSGSWLGYH
jgi:hypothetical protein